MKTSQPNFLHTLWQYYQDNGRHAMAWRQDTSPYNILVSEVMLQQTGVDRVKPKFEQFTSQLPNWLALANAPTKEVLQLWQGLGYNRRALFLQRAAQAVVHTYNGQLPKDRSALESLPGIGQNTSGAILVYAYNQPIVFIETNIRRVLIHHFFAKQNNITDKEILPVLTSLISNIESQESKFIPQSFYWAMMDYGTHLKSQVANPNKRSAHYTVQSKFFGSSRQLRGAILQTLTSQSIASKSELTNLAISENQRADFNKIVSQLEKEGFIHQTQKGYSLR